MTIKTRPIRLSKIKKIFDKTKETERPDLINSLSKVITKNYKSTLPENFIDRIKKNVLSVYKKRRSVRSRRSANLKKKVSKKEPKKQRIELDHLLRIKLENPKDFASIIEKMLFKEPEKNGEKESKIIGNLSKPPGKSILSYYDENVELPEQQIIVKENKNVKLPEQQIIVKENKNVKLPEQQINILENKNTKKAIKDDNEEYFNEGAEITEADIANITPKQIEYYRSLEGKSLRDFKRIAGWPRKSAGQQFHGVSKNEEPKIVAMYLKNGGIIYGSGSAFSEDALTNYEIDNIMENEKNYIGCYCLDDLNEIIDYIKKHKIRHFNFIINTLTEEDFEEDEDMIGHWISIWCDSDIGDFCIFDPLGSENHDVIEIIKKEFNKYFEKTELHHLKFKTNSVREQAAFSHMCGWFCIRFIRMMNCGLSFKEATGFDDIKENEKDVNDLEKRYNKFGYI